MPSPNRRAEREADDQFRDPQLHKGGGARRTGSATSESSWAGRFGRDYRVHQGRGERLGDIYERELTDSDPREAFRRETGAAIEDLRERFGEDLQRLRHSQVGSGRVDTGFGYKDEDLLFRGLSRDWLRGVERNALETEGLNLSRLRDIGDLGYSYGRDALDASSGTWQTLRQQRLADKANKRSFWGSLISAGLTAAGTYFGGLPGGAAAAAITGSAGS